MPDAIVRSPEVVEAPLYDALVLLNLDTNGMHELNEVGARIWALIERETSHDAIVAALVDEFDVPHDRCSHEVETFVQFLRDRKLLGAA